MRWRRTRRRAANIRRYAEIVRDRGVLRKLITVADEISGQAFSPQGKEVKQILDEAESKIFAIAEEGARGAQGFLEIQPLLTQVVERIDELYNRDNQSEITGVPTGFIDLDRMTSGLQPGDLIIVAGRPSMGKTAFSINIGENVAIESGPAGRGVLDGDGRRPAGDAYAGLGRPARPAPPAHRPPERRRLAAPDARDPEDERCPALHRRNAGAELDRAARALAPPGAPVRQAGPDHRRLPAADVGQFEPAKTAPPKSRKFRAP